MRFEIRWGGIAAILCALTLLSGAVFVLGLLAGYDVGRQSQLDTAQLATNYPVQTAPLASASPAAPMTPSASENPPGGAVVNSSVPASGSVENRPSLPPSAAKQGVAAASIRSRTRTPMGAAAPSRQRVASATIPPSAPSRAVVSPSEDDTDAASESEPAEKEMPDGSRPVSQPRHHKPYNIQIQAAMDVNGADQMMARLQRLGYQSHLVPTEIDGQRWYKVEVGPYATHEEASGAEAELREKYDATYGGVTRGTSAGQQTAGGDSEE
jgi:cell division septation protein DedD